MRKMKDSGIEWVGLIPDTWETIRHKYIMHKEKDICEKYSGQDIISLSMDGVKIRDLDAGGKMPATFDGYQYVKPGDLLLCLFDIDVTPRCVGLVKDYGLTSPAYSRFVLHDGYFNGYYNYLLRAIDDKKIFVHLAKNLRSSLTETDFGLLPTIVPSYDEQVRISDYLDRQIPKIELLIKQTSEAVEKYRELKKSVITNAVTHAISSEKKLIKTEYEWASEIPDGWDVIKITRILDYSHNYPIGDGDHGLIKTEDYLESGVPYIRVQNIGWGTDLIEDNMVYISEEKNQAIGNSTLRPNDILFAKTGATIGKTAIIPDSINIANTTSHIGKLTVSDEYNPRYVFYVMSSFIVYKQFWEMACLKTTRPELSIDEIKKVKLVIPPTRREQDEIVEYLDKICVEMDVLISKKEKYLAKLEELKESVIYEYVTGKREVPDCY